MMYPRRAGHIGPARDHQVIRAGAQHHWLRA